MVGAVFRGSEAIRAGELTWERLRGPAYRRVFPDVYAPAELSLDLVARSRAAYLLVRDSGGVLSGYSAALPLGADCAPKDAPAEVIVPGGRRSCPGIRVQRATIAPADMTTAAGCQLTNPPRTAWDLARRRLPTVEAVVAVDALARVGGFDPLSCCSAATANPVHVAAAAWPMWSRWPTLAESPMETRLRVALARVGLPPKPRFAVHDEYGFVLARVTWHTLRPSSRPSTTARPMSTAAAPSSTTSATPCSRATAGRPSA
ncbi:MAG TPA: hypothetical protein VH008_01640 [Pseudonocardia sp.]|nr:hypothetical protein [Pseudonocardia sp.]